MRFIVSFSAFICILVLTNCTNVPSAHNQDNPFDSTGTNWNPPTVVAKPTQQIVSVGDTAVIAAQGIDNEEIAGYFWTVDGVSQSVTYDTLRLPTASQGTRIVCVYVRDNDGVRSNVDSVLVLGKDKAPLLTAPVNGTQLTNNGPTLTWLEGYYNNHYKVLIDTITPPRNVGVATTVGNSFTPTTGFLFSKNYYWQIIGYHSSGVEAGSQIWGFKTGDLPATPMDGLVGYWPFNGNAKDESGNGNDGIVRGIVGARDRWAAVNSALSFDSTNSAVTIPPSITFNSLESFSIIVWLNLASTSESPVLEWNTNSQEQTHVWVNTTRFGWLGPGISIYDTAGARRCIVSAAPNFISSKWYCLAVTYDRATGTVSVYTNGNINVQQSVEKVKPAMTGNLCIGYRPTGTIYPAVFNGLLDDIRIYNRALSVPEIQSLYHEGGWAGQ
jgi:hypothetical protein